MKKTLKTLLKGNEYKTYDKDSLAKIEKTAREYLGFKDAFWFGELAEPVQSYDKLRIVSAKQNSFNLGNIYSILRKGYSLGKDDKLELNYPEGLVTEDNFEEIKEKANQFYKFSLGKDPYKNRQYLLQDISLEDKGLSRVDFWDGRAEGIPANWEDSKDLLGRVYFDLAKKNLIAYQDTKKAIEFFENETGISLSKPKEYKKLVF